MMATPAFAAVGGVISSSSKALVPQYALWTDDSNNRVPVIVIQAEIIHAEREISKRMATIYRIGHTGC